MITSLVPQGTIENKGGNDSSAPSSFVPDGT